MYTPCGLSIATSGQYDRCVADRNDCVGKQNPSDHSRRRQQKEGDGHDACLRSRIPFSRSHGVASSGGKAGSPKVIAIVRGRARKRTPITAIMTPASAAITSPIVPIGFLSMKGTITALN